MTCQTGDTCNTGYTCCVAPADLSINKKTCRTIGDCVSTASSSVITSSSTKKTTTTSSIKATTTTTNASGSTATNLPSGFPGTNTGIGSWFKANSADSSTNGNSWCGYPYKDYTPGFAPDISVMTDGTNAVYGNPNWATYGKRYCGLEAIVTNPNNGVSMTLYITDAFDHAWVRTPGSIDIMFDSFSKLFGKTTTNHNDVIKDITWKFTGNKLTKYSFQSTGDP
ncbi:hypothetical protein HK096_005420 [Nowakowskiella sp. JEL0078]|nr:hypothetical protein HK096_005420 [Nowakowskiella sp. JEL0078]